MVVATNLIQRSSEMENHMRRQTLDGRSVECGAVIAVSLVKVPILETASNHGCNGSYVDQPFTCEDNVTCRAAS